VYEDLVAVFWEWLSRHSDSWQGQEFFSLPPLPDKLWRHPASYLMGNVGSTLVSKASGAWSWPTTSV